MKRTAVKTVGVCLLLVLGQSLFADDFDRLSKAVSATEHHSARFTQTFRPHGSEQGLVESGVVIFGTLPQMRWTYEAPEKKVFVFDGATSSLYVPADHQVSIHRLSEAERRKLPFLLLKDEKAARKNFEISSSRIEGSEKLTLAPRDQETIQYLIVSIDPKSGRILSIEYEDIEGNRTRFLLQSFRKSKTDEKTFHIDPPDGVEVVEY